MPGNFPGKSMRAEGPHYNRCGRWCGLQPWRFFPLRALGRCPRLVWTAPLALQSPFFKRGICDEFAGIIFLRALPPLLHAKPGDRPLGERGGALVEPGLDGNTQSFCLLPSCSPCLRARVPTAAAEIPRSAPRAGGRCQESPRSPAPEHAAAARPSRISGATPACAWR